jgi:osmoprotectant transport system ATP-binding protein
VTAGGAGVPNRSDDTVPDDMPVPAIEFRSVSFARADVSILDRFSLTIQTGETLALVGRSGAGKTTILKLINRLLTPDAGQVLVDGKDTRDWDATALRRSVGYVLQDVGLFPHFTVFDNVAVVPRLDRWPAARIQSRVEELLGLINLPLDRFGARFPEELSGGQRQRVGVARALAVDPPILLMDEPFGALDPLTRVELHREFDRIRRRLRKTVVIVTHDMGEAFALADRIGVLDDGRLIACDGTERIARSDNLHVRRFLDAIPAVPHAAPAEAPQGATKDP